jgi:hypothetical protein
VKLLPVITVTGLSVLGLGASAEDLKLGIIGLDTSHVTAFTKILNDSSDPKHVPGGKVVAEGFWCETRRLD